MWERFLKAMEYRAYCKAAQVLRLQGNAKELKKVLTYKHNLYYSKT